MRLRIDQFEFHAEGRGIAVVVPGKTKILARIVPDDQYPTMWRVVRPDGSLTDMVNLTRAKDIAFGLAETALFLRPHRAAALEPA